MPTAIVRSPRDLSVDQLVDIVKQIQHILFGVADCTAGTADIDPDALVLDPEREFEAEDLEHIASVLHLHGLAPGAEMEEN